MELRATQHTVQRHPCDSLTFTNNRTYCSRSSSLTAAAAALSAKKPLAEQLDNYALNDLLSRGFALASFPVNKEPNQSEGKRPDGLTLIRWQRAGPFVGTSQLFFSPLAESYVNGADREAGAASRKEEKYADI